jgi:hypothetical protein
VEDFKLNDTASAILSKKINNTINSIDVSLDTDVFEKNYKGIAQAHRHH